MSLRDIVIVGAGGLGREVLFQLWEMNAAQPRYNILGFADDRVSLVGTEVDDVPVIGDIEYLIRWKHSTDVCVCVSNPVIRKFLVKRLSKNPNLSFPNILAPDLRCSNRIQWGIGAIVSFSNIITIDVTIGDFVFLGNSCIVGHDSVLNEYATLYNGVTVSGNCRIGECVEVGIGSRIIQGCSIGSQTIVGAGSVVIEELPCDCTAVGIPAKPIKYRQTNTSTAM